MLERLSVRDFAIIEDICVKFNNNMTVLTGETGAGKSLIIDSISLLLGARADSDMIRYGKHMASIEGVFTHNSEVDELFNKYNIPIKNEIIILREIYDNSRNVIKINNINVSLTVLKNISSYLADIHVQNDTYKLFNVDSYLDIIDPINDSKFDKLINKYSKDLYLYQEAIKENEIIKKGQKTALERLEYIKYEYEELTNLNLYEDVDKILEEKISKLSNFDKIHSNLTNAYNLLSDEYEAIDKLYEAAKYLKNISEFDSIYQQYNEKLLDSYYICSEIKDDISRNLNNLDYDEDELNSYIESLNEINKVKEKYKRNVKELIEYLNKITLEIDLTENYDETLNQSNLKCQRLYDILVKSAMDLTKYRKNLALNIEKTIINECLELDLDNTKFKIEFNSVIFDNYLDKSIFFNNGVDLVSFMISFNKGEPLKMLNKVASGGELSRIMLAFKSYLSKYSKVSLMVFDEIDTGVSGQTAKKIAKKMNEIAKNVQVLCITHLPQVAAIGNYHKHIYKLEENNRTITQIEDLDYQRRIEEIALMLSGDKMSVYALEHATALLEENK